MDFAVKPEQPTESTFFNGFCVAEKGQSFTETLNIDYFRLSCSLILFEDFFSCNGCFVKCGKYELGKRFAYYKFKGCFYHFCKLSSLRLIVLFYFAEYFM